METRKKIRAPDGISTHDPATGDSMVSKGEMWVFD